MLCINSVLKAAVSLPAPTWQPTGWACPGPAGPEQRSLSQGWSEQLAADVLPDLSLSCPHSAGEAPWAAARVLEVAWS